MFTLDQVAAAAEKAGYEDKIGYIDDHELKKCRVCAKYGVLGDETAPLSGSGQAEDDEYICLNCFRFEAHGGEDV